MVADGILEVSTLTRVPLFTIWPGFLLGERSCVVRALQLDSFREPTDSDDPSAAAFDIKDHAHMFPFPLTADPAATAARWRAAVAPVGTAALVQAVPAVRLLDARVAALPMMLLPRPWQLVAAAPSSRANATVVVPPLTSLTGPVRFCVADECGPADLSMRVRTGIELDSVLVRELRIGEEVICLPQVRGCGS